MLNNCNVISQEVERLQVETQDKNGIVAGSKESSKVNCKDCRRKAPETV